MATRTLFVMFCLSVVAGAQTPQLNQPPLAPGAYVKSGDQWVKLEPTVSSGGGAKHVAKMFVPGLTPQIVWTFRKAEASVQLSQTKPQFYIRRSPNLPDIPGQMPRDFVIVRFDKKKDHRELQASSGGNALTFKAGLSQDRLPDVVVEPVSEGLFVLSPKADLAPGEYLITQGMGNSGMDFGISSLKSGPKKK